MSIEMQVTKVTPFVMLGAPGTAPNRTEPAYAAASMQNSLNKHLDKR
ncbi:hypothetical protein [Dactylosporangium sp. NPDC000521]